MFSTHIPPYAGEVSTLSIHLPTPGGHTPEAAEQTIAVSHLAVRDADTGSGISLGVSPGVQLLLPVDTPVRLVVGSEVVSVPRGMVLVTDGRAHKAAADAVETESPPLPGRTLRIVELNALINNAFPLREQLALPLLLDYKYGDIVNTLFDQLSFEGGGILFPVGSVDISRHLLAARLVIMLLAAAGKPARNERQREHDEQLARLRQFLLENMDGNVTNPDMARHLGMSRTAFCRWARLHLGCPPARYFRHLRLERSQECMARDAADLEEIARQTGFSDRYHLGKEFKKHFGLTPAQYRRLCRATPKADSMARAADRLFRHDRFDDALAACEEALRENPPPMVRDRVRYQKGLCLQALGQTAEAIEEWKALEGSPVGHRAGLQRCRQLFDTAKPVQALEAFEMLYPAADDLQRRDLIHLWMDQVAALIDARRPRLLRRYLAVREKLFLRNLSSMHVTADALREMGEDAETPRQCAALAFACFFALRRTGNLDEAIALYRSRVAAIDIANSLSLTGRWEEVLAMRPEFPLHGAQALTALGRPEAAIARYPNHCACAYLALKRYQELLDRFPEDTEENIERIHALHALGRTRELRNFTTQHSWQWVEAQLYACPEAVLIAKTPEARKQSATALLLLALRALSQNNRHEAEAALERIDGVRSRKLWWEDHNSSELLLVSAVRGLLGDTELLHKDLDEILTHHKLKNKQALWHDAAYLSGQVTAALYRRQPQQKNIASRLAFIRALAHDLEGRRAAARRAYRRFIANTQPYGPENLLRQRFAEWRL